MLVSRVGAGVIGQKHPLAQRAVRGKGHHRLHLRWVGGDRNATVYAWPMPREIVFRQPVQLNFRGLYRLCALLNVAVEFERKPCRPFMQRLQLVACGLVLVDAGQSITEQRSLDVMLCGRAGRIRRVTFFQIDCRKSLIDRAIQTQSARGLRHPLCFHLRLIAHGLVGGHRIQYAGLRAGQAELLNGRVVEPKRVFRRALAFDGQQCGQRRLVRRQARAHPCGKRLGGIGSARLPDVEVFRGVNDCRFFRSHDRQTPNF